MLKKKNLPQPHRNRMALDRNRTATAVILQCLSRNRTATAIFSMREPATALRVRLTARPRGAGTPRRALVCTT